MDRRIKRQVPLGNTKMSPGFLGFKRWFLVLGAWCNTEGYSILVFVYTLSESLIDIYGGYNFLGQGFLGFYYIFLLVSAS